MSKFVSFALFVSAVLLVRIELQKTQKNRPGENQPLGEAKEEALGGHVLQFK